MGHHPTVAGSLLEPLVLHSLLPKIIFMKFCSRLLALAVVLSPIMGCGGSDENSVPDASAPAPAGASGMTESEAERLRQLSEEANAGQGEL